MASTFRLSPALSDEAPPMGEHVVLLDSRGRPSGVLPKAEVHGPATPLHLAFSCHVVRGDGRVLLSQRSSAKRTWPGVWTNACCGHPALDEPLGEAAARRLRDELGVTATAMALALPDFTYRAVMDDGTVEHELCPVLIAHVDDDPRPAADEVAAIEWVTWDDLLARAERAPESLSPWAVAQLARLRELGTSPADWLAAAVAAPLGAPVAGLAGAAHGPSETWLGAPPAPSPPALSPSPRRLDPARFDPPRRDPFAPVLAPLQSVLAGFVAERRAEMLRIDSSLAEVSDEIEGLLDAGGKRLRPAFVYWGHRATGAEHDPEVLLPAGAVELLHTFALLHDDVMDRSAVRRGRAAGHAALAACHRADDRLGDSTWFGVSAAILAGDLTFVWADELFESAALPAECMARARRVFTTLRSEVIAGQYLDLGLAASRHADEAAARKVALLKSARYTVTRPLLLGAALAGSTDPAVDAALRAYGDAVGVAFQMRDDVLGLFGDPSQTGKGVLDDLREGKRTLLMLRALALATPVQRGVITAGLGDPELDEVRAAAIRTVVADTGALASVEALSSAHHATAQSALRLLPEPARAALGQLAALAIERHA